jgi:hypothetical protein
MKHSKIQMFGDAEYKQKKGCLNGSIYATGGHL